VLPYEECGDFKQILTGCKIKEGEQIPSSSVEVGSPIYRHINKGLVGNYSRRIFEALSNQHMDAQAPLAPKKMILDLARNKNGLAPFRWESEFNSELGANNNNYTHETMERYHIKILSSNFDWSNTTLSAYIIGMVELYALQAICPRKLPAALAAQLVELPVCWLIADLCHNLATLFPYDRSEGRFHPLVYLLQGTKGEEESPLFVCRNPNLCDSFTLGRIEKIFDFQLLYFIGTILSTMFPSVKS